MLQNSFSSKNYYLSKPQKKMHFDKKEFLLVVKIEDFDLFVTEL